MCESIKVKCTSTKVLENGNYGIYLVENYPCNTKDELRMRERFFIENNQCVNKCIPIRLEEEKNKLLIEHYNKNKTERLKNMKIYYSQHKLEIDDYQKKYREENRAKLGEYKNQYNKQEEAKIKQRVASKRYRDKKRVNEFFLNYLQCFNVEI